MPLEEFRIQIVSEQQRRQLEELFLEMEFKTHAERWRVASVHLAKHLGK